MASTVWGRGHIPTSHRPKAENITLDSFWKEKEENFSFPEPPRKSSPQFSQAPIGSYAQPEPTIKATWSHVLHPKAKLNAKETFRMIHGVWSLYCKNKPKSCDMWTYICISESEKEWRSWMNQCGYIAGRGDPRMLKGETQTHICILWFIIISWHYFHHANIKEF